MEPLLLLGGSSQDLQVVRITCICMPWKGHLEGQQPYLGDLLTMTTLLSWVSVFVFPVRHPAPFFHPETAAHQQKTAQKQRNATPKTTLSDVWRLSWTVGRMTTTWTYWIGRLKINSQLVGKPQTLVIVSSIFFGSVDPRTKKNNGTKTWGIDVKQHGFRRKHGYRCLYRDFTRSVGWKYKQKNVLISTQSCEIFL